MALVERGVFWVSVGVLSLLAASCGESNSGSSYHCGKVQPCGGNLVGTWKFKSACVDPSAASAAVTSAMTGGATCSTATVQSTDAKVSGSMTFNADNTYQSDMTLTTTVKMLLPSECLTFQGITVSCDQLNQVVASGAVTGIDSFKCSTAGTGCSCAVAVSNKDTSSGTYTASGNSVALSNSLQGGGDYCVQNNELHLISLSMPMGTGETKVTADMVATK